MHSRRIDVDIENVDVDHLRCDRHRHLHPALPVDDNRRAAAPDQQPDHDERASGRQRVANRARPLRGSSMRQILFRGRHAWRWTSGAAVLSVAAALLATPSPSFAQSEDRPATLSTLFEDIFGPRGLVLNSDDVQLDGSNHAAHFNSAFQSEFRLMNVALTSQLATVPLPSPASGFTYHFDAATGTFVRIDAQLRPDPGRTRRDHRPRQDRVRLHLSVLLLRPSGRRADHRRPGGLHARQFASRRRPCRRRRDGATPSKRRSRSSRARSPTG